MEPDLETYERRFRHAGLPNLIEGWSASEDVFTRASPLLAFVVVGELLGAVDRDWSLWANLAAGLGGLAFLVAGFGFANCSAAGASPSCRTASAASSWRCS